jgi:hypothetical protein
MSWQLFLLWCAQGYPVISPIVFGMWACCALMERTETRRSTFPVSSRGGFPCLCHLRGQELGRKRFRAASILNSTDQRRARRNHGSERNPEKIKHSLRDTRRPRRHVHMLHLYFSRLGRVQGGCRVPVQGIVHRQQRFLVAVFPVGRPPEGEPKHAALPPSVNRHLSDFSGTY